MSSKGKRNIFAVVNMYQAPTPFVSALDESMRRTIQYIRIINFDFLAEKDAIRRIISLDSPDFTSPRVEGRHTVLNRILQTHSQPSTPFFFDFGALI